MNDKELFARCICAQIEMAGMVAENMQRQHLDFSMAFVEDDFFSLLKRYGLEDFGIVDTE